MSEFTKGVLLGVALYWAVQHFTGIGKTGKATPSS